MRLGYFGGSFDPPHRGHLAIALAAAEAFGLERVLLAPTGRQPWKRDGAEAGFADRLAMVRLLCEAAPEILAASTADGPRADGAPNYTVDTLTELQIARPEAEIFAIVGADSLTELPHWREAARLFELATWIAVSRPEYGFPDPLPAELKAVQATGRLQLLRGVAVPVSSTELRQRLRDGQDTRDALPEAVGTYLRGKGLYTGATGQ